MFQALPHSGHVPSAPQPLDGIAGHTSHQMEPPPSYSDVMENLLNKYNANEETNSFKESNESMIGNVTK